MNARPEDFAPRALTREELEAHWMPFTANRHFKANPRLLSHARGVHYWTADGRQILDGVAGLWCVNAGHGRREITQAVANSLDQMDFAPPFQMGHPQAFDLANKVKQLAPAGLDHVFFVNSGSEAVDTALKIALQYQRLKGEATRTRLIGRERGYHGVNLGGTTLGGMVANRKAWGAAMIPGVDHLSHTHNPAKNAFSKGQPEHGAELANELERLVALHDASSIAAVIVEPIAGSTGVLVPPKGYLQRLRELCTKHGILLIFDEVITGFGRTGSAFGAQEFGVTPDLITCAKGLTNGAVPMGAVIVKKEIHDAFMTGPETAIELFHGYTYSCHPTACAAGIATLDIYEKEGIFQRVKDLAPYWEQAVHSLKGLPHVTDIRNYGLVAGIEYEPIAGAPGKRGFEVFLKAFEAGILVRAAGDITALSPPLIMEKAQIDQLVETLGKVLKAAA
ncbi:MAG TPA: aspartate aminotransferase family protein [Steroidobacteraceae bacterium]|nr:aspartate aminotransferase family protein [Steroidobacteraceae bacterium]